MKHYPIPMLSSLAILVYATSIAQSCHTVAGIYLSYQDFRNQKISFPLHCDGKSEKLKLNVLLAGPTVTVQSNGERQTLDKDLLYGYSNCHGKRFRFYQHEAYEILDTSGFYLYYQYRSVEETRGKSLIKTDQYFFSRTDTENLIPLTVENLEEAFPDNEKFHYALEANFNRDVDLVAYDRFQKIYKIEYLFKQSIK
jgi:hypothetical protein